MKHKWEWRYTRSDREEGYNKCEQCGDVHNGPVPPKKGCKPLADFAEKECAEAVRAREKEIAADFDAMGFTFSKEVRDYIDRLRGERE